MTFARYVQVRLATVVTQMCIVVVVIAAKE